MESLDIDVEVESRLLKLVQPEIFDIVLNLVYINSLKLIKVFEKYFSEHFILIDRLQKAINIAIYALTKGKFMEEK